MRFTSKLQPIIRAKETTRMIIALRSIRKNLALNALFRLSGHERKSSDVHDPLAVVVARRAGCALRHFPWPIGHGQNPSLGVRTSGLRPRTSDWHRVVSAVAPGMATTNPPHREPTAAQRAVSPNRFQRVGRTTRGKTTTSQRAK